MKNGIPVTGADQPSLLSGFRLFILGFLTLFLELALIRFLAGNVWNLGYFPNLVLLAVFLGMGAGFVFHHFLSKPASNTLTQTSVFVLLALMSYVFFRHPAVPGFGPRGGSIGGELYFTANPVKSGTESFLPFLVLFLTVLVLFAFISQRTAKLFRLFPPLTAYTLDISGSCCGILAFMLVSWLQLPAFLWFLAVIPMFHLIQWQSLKSWYLMVPLAGIVLLAWGQDSKISNPDFSGAFEAHWSPYQKVEYVKRDSPPLPIFVNGIGHQVMWDGNHLLKSFYNFPYQIRTEGLKLPAYRNILVVGAGSGNDVSAALLNGAKHVDAVEIDPAIVQLGRRYNPLQPYADPRVTLHVDDGRAFMTSTRDRYDLIVFAATDSVVKASPMAQLRLENFLFTVESIRRAYSILSDNGDIVFYNYYRHRWLIDKIKMTVFQATGKYPMTVKDNGDFALLMVGKLVAGDPPASQERLEPAVDDWPFPYLKERGIPRIYLIAMGSCGLLILSLFFFVRTLPQGISDAPAPGNTQALKAVFLLMGLAFLLLETKGVIQFSLLFGTTWLNNSLVFLAILVLVLLANWTAMAFHSTRALWASYLSLMAFCILAVTYPLSHLLVVQNGFFRFIFASVMIFSPIFFANVIFGIVFRDQAIAEHLFGWNLIGAALGGILEYGSMAVGYNFLAFVVALCYSVVFLMLLNARKAAEPPAEASGSTTSGRL